MHKLEVVAAILLALWAFGSIIHYLGGLLNIILIVALIIVVYRTVQRIREKISQNS